MNSGVWSEQRIDGRPCDLFEPSQANPHGFVLVYLHGVHQTRLIDKPAFTNQFKLRGLPVVAPLTGQSWWADRICEEFDPEMTAERYLLDCVAPFIQNRYGGAARIGLLGTSMGGQGALRLAYKHPDRFPVVAAISPAINYQMRIREGDPNLLRMYGDEESARQDTALLHIHPLNWPRHQFFCCDPEDHRWWDGADLLKMKLYSLGVPHESDLETSAGGHGFQYYDRMAERAVGFCAERLDQERRRVV